jgi:dCMP deaminase
MRWEKYLMDNELIKEKRRKEKVKKVGDCIVNKEKRIVSIGYNGMNNGDDEFTWSKEGK